MSSIPMRPRGLRFRPDRFRARLRRGEPLEPNVSPHSLPPQSWTITDPDPYQGIVRTDLARPFPAVPGGPQVVAHPVATLQFRPLGPPPPPRNRLPAWPWAPGYPFHNSDESNQWDAAINVAHRVPTVDLSVSPHWDRSPRAAGLDLLARILSAKRWTMSGNLGGVSLSAEWAAGSTVQVTGGGVTETPMSDTTQGWRPFHLSVFMTGGGVQVRMMLSVLEGVFAEGDWSHSEGMRGLDAAMVMDAPVLMPRIRGWVEMRDAESISFWHVDSVTSLQCDAPVELPILLCGMPLMGGLDKVENSFPASGSLRIDLLEPWGPDEWPEA